MLHCPCKGRSMAVTLTTQSTGTTNRTVKDTAATNTAVLNVTVRCTLYISTILPIQTPFI